jgi:hypothetical protein
MVIFFIDAVAKHLQLIRIAHACKVDGVNDTHILRMKYAFPSPAHNPHSKTDKSLAAHNCKSPGATSSTTLIAATTL